MFDMTPLECDDDDGPTPERDGESRGGREPIILDSSREVALTPFSLHLTLTSLTLIQGNPYFVNFHSGHFVFTSTLINQPSSHRIKSRASDQAVIQPQQLYSLHTHSIKQSFQLLLLLLVISQ